ncbi:MAG: hypothetical protein IJL57_04715 [Bacteroidales bacterium]|nr:hypothetical protein [Bacteroidales bacterium]
MARLYTPSSSSCCRSSWRGWRLWWGNGDGTLNGVLRNIVRDRTTDMEPLTGFMGMTERTRRYLRREIHIRGNGSGE